MSLRKVVRNQAGNERQKHMASAWNEELNLVPEGGGKNHMALKEIVRSTVGRGKEQ